MVEDKLFSGESVNIEYKVEVPKKSEKYMKTVITISNGARIRSIMQLKRLSGNWYRIPNLKKRSEKKSVQGLTQMKLKEKSKIWKNSIGS